jgi:hypothetical protein
MGNRIPGRNPPSLFGDDRDLAAKGRKSHNRKLSEFSDVLRILCLFAAIPPNLRCAALEASFSFRAALENILLFLKKFGQRASMLVFVYFVCFVVDPSVAAPLCCAFRGYPRTPFLV